MKSLKPFSLIGVFVLALLSGCAGGGGNGGGGQTPDWTFEIQPVKGIAKPQTDLGNLTNLGALTPGQAVPAVNILAVAKNGFAGKVTLSDVAGAGAAHIAAVPSSGSVSPTAAGAPFSVSFTIPATYSSSTPGIAFQGTDSQGRTKVAHIAFTVATVGGSFAQQTFKTSDLSDSGTLVLTPIGGLAGQIAVSFDTHILSTDGANKGDLQIPNTVTVTAPSSPVTLAAQPVSTPIDFKWTSWSVGNYAVIAVLKKANTAMAVRVPLEIVISNGSTSGNTGTVSTWQYGPNRDGANSAEATLTIANVKTSSFGRLFTHALDAVTEGQPLYLPNVKVKGATHNVVFVATTNNSVYAFDADSAGGTNAQPLWKVNLGAAAPRGTEDGGNETLDGILSTPVIQVNKGATTTGTLYVCAKTMNGGAFAFTLHGLDVTSGAETAGGPVGVTATISGKQGAVTLDPKNSYQRPGLLLVNNEVYVAIGGMFGDPAPDRGWVIAYNASNLQQREAAFTTCPDLATGAPKQIGGSIWMAAGGPSSDGTNVFVTTGNGDFDVSAGGSDYGDSIIKLSPSLQVLSYFSPSNNVTLENGDEDLGSGTPMLIPSIGGSPPLVFQNTKTNEIYLTNANSLGGFHAGADQIYQELAIGADREYLCSPAYANGFVYVARGNNLQAFSIKSGKLSAGASGTAPTVFNGYLPTPVISYSGNSTPIVWAIEDGAVAVLHAYNATTMAEVYNSNMSAARDGAGGFAKFAPPAVINGKVYVPCSNELAAYGLIGPKAYVSSPRR